MMHETTPCQAQVKFRDSVFGCFIGKLMGNVIGAEPMFLDSLSAEDLRSFIKSSTFDCFNHDLASLKAFQKTQGYPSSFDIAQAWLAGNRYVDHSLAQVYENLERGLFPPMSGTYRRSIADPAICWSRGHLWVFLGDSRTKWLDKVIRADAEIDCCRSESISYAPALAATQDYVLRGTPLDVALQEFLELPGHNDVATAISSAIDAAKGYRDLYKATDSYLFNSKRRHISPTGTKFGALLLLWMQSGGSISQALSASRQYGLLDPAFGAVLGGLLGLSTGVSAIDRRLRDAALEMSQSIRIAPNQTVDLISFADDVADAALQESRTREVAVAERPGPYRSRKSDYQQIRFPYRVFISRADLDFEFDYIHEPEFHICSSRMLSLSIRCKDLQKRQLRVCWHVNDGATISPAIKESVLQPNTRRVFTVNCFAHRAMNWIEGSVSVAYDSRGEVRIPFALALAPTVRYDSLTRKPGASVTSDSETPSAPGCTQYIIDGQIGKADGEHHGFWESDNREGPHWLQINLPKPMRTNRILVHFADNECYPQDFRATVSDNGLTWTTIGEETGYVNNNVFELGPFDLRIKHFRFEITRSSNNLRPNVSKVSEVEMIPLGRGRNRVR